MGEENDLVGTEITVLLQTREAENVRRQVSFRERPVDSALAGLAMLTRGVFDARMRLVIEIVEDRRMVTRTGCGGELEPTAGSLDRAALPRLAATYFSHHDIEGRSNALQPHTGSDLQRKKTIPSQPFAMEFQHHSRICPGFGVGCK